MSHCGSQQDHQSMLLSCCSVQLPYSSCAFKLRCVNPATRMLPGRHVQSKCGFLDLFLAGSIGLRPHQTSGRMYWPKARGLILVNIGGKSLRQNRHTHHGIVPSDSTCRRLFIQVCSISGKPSSISDTEVGGRQVWAELVAVQLGDVAGFDLSYLNRYRWHPQAERVDLTR